MNKKTANGLYPHVVDKGLVISKYKGEYQAKRIMMRAGLPIDVINTVLSEDKHAVQDSKPNQPTP
jgi:hypothetical protein